ncbi:MAG: hypothetical protein R3A45_10430 [Bdellovibrionota bacterium]
MKLPRDFATVYTVFIFTTHQLATRDYPIHYSRFVQYLSTHKQYKTKSIMRACSAVRSWAKYLIKRNLWQDGKTPIFPKMQQPRSIPHPITQQQVIALIEAPDINIPIGLRDRAF